MRIVLCDQDQLHRMSLTSQHQSGLRQRRHQRRPDHIRGGRWVEHGAPTQALIRLRGMVHFSQSWRGCSPLQRGNQNSISMHWERSTLSLWLVDPLQPRPPGVLCQVTKNMSSLSSLGLQGRDRVTCQPPASQGLGPCHVSTSSLPYHNRHL